VLKKMGLSCPQTFPLHIKDVPMTCHSLSHSSGTPFNEPKASTPKINPKPALMAGLKGSKRVQGTLHLPAFVWPRL
jgi:hypothetical protein